MAITNEEIRAAQVGREIATIFGLKKNDAGKYITSYGTKTEIGLGRMIKRIVFKY